MLLIFLLFFKKFRKILKYFIITLISICFIITGILLYISFNIKADSYVLNKTDNLIELFVRIENNTIFNIEIDDLFVHNFKNDKIYKYDLGLSEIKSRELIEKVIAFNGFYNEFKNFYGNFCINLKKFGLNIKFSTNIE
ncbi:hypothetical protein DMUE_2490 [Dictyocoela muelleri]|nr:hypothetical protein DMUE_2490 [Dictyocoela muelleri]